jgi:hypothetical protein
VTHEQSISTPSAEELARRGIGVETKKVRARNKDGTLKADDPSTPNVNEAWEKVKKVVKRPSKKKDD